MKRFAKLFVALALLAGTILTPFTSTTTTATAETTALIGTGYTKASDVVYKTASVSVSSIKGDIIVNWCARDEDCVFLSTYAQEYYEVNGQDGTSMYDSTWVNQKSPSTTSQSAASTTTLYKNLQTFLTSKHKIYTIYQGSPNPKTLLQYTDCVRNDTSKVSLIYSGAMVKGAWDGSTYDQ